MSLPSNGNEDPRYSRSGAVYVPAGDGVTKWFSGDVYTIKASAESTNGSLGLVEATYRTVDRNARYIHPHRLKGPTPWPR